MAFSFDQTAVIRYAAGLYGLKLGSATLAGVNQQLDRASNSTPDYLNSVLNSYYSPFVGQTSAQVAATVVANAGIVAGSFGLTAANVSAAVAIVTSALNAAAPFGTQGGTISNILKQWSEVSVNDAVYGAAARAWNTTIDQATTYAATAGTANVALSFNNTNFVLTAANDSLIGTAGNDTFTAILGNLGSADVINGGAGADILKANVNGILSPTISGVERLEFQAQFRTADSGDNNLTDQQIVKVDFNTNVTSVTGFTSIENSNSRADLIIEDVRIADNQRTEDITIVMRETDPGNVDYGVYFDQNSLRSVSSATSSINIFLMDTAAANAAATAATPLLNQTFNSYTFYAGGDKVVLGGAGTPAGAAIDAATTYAALKAALELALKSANVAGTVRDISTSVTVGTSGPVNMTTEALKSAESATVAASFLNLTGEILTLTTNSVTGISSSSPAGVRDGGWASSGTAPSTGAIVQTFNSGATTATGLVTSKIILDDVGRGSTGGDLVVGGLSVGETSTSKGVEKFQIEVQDNSKLQTINSTANTLREVVITSGTTTRVNNAFNENEKDAGSLTVRGIEVPNVSDTTGNIGGRNNDVLPGLEQFTTSLVDGGRNVGRTQHNEFGFSDVRVIDASAFKGKLDFDAEVTKASIAKYLPLGDTDVNPLADNVAVAFTYTGGTNNDTMAVTIEGDAAGSRSSVVSGQADFNFTVNGGAGNDAITVNVVNTTDLTGGLQNWAANQDLNNNITINGGDGNDTIRTPGAGDTTIDAGAGNDVVYTDNTGRQTVRDLNGAVGITATTTTSNARFVFNTFDQVNAVANGAARNLIDLRSDSNDSYNFFKGTVTVTFKGLPSVAVTLANATTFKTTDLEINQAIKQAINTDPTLNKLLVATDGPANTLVVTSLIDGVMSAADLTVGFAAAPATTVYTAAEIAGMATAYGNAAITTNALALAVQQLPNAIRTDYNTALAKDSNGANIVGAASTSTSDNFIAAGVGNDVIVLGTTVGVDVARSSNEVVTLAAGFGDDVIVNFNATGAGADHLNLAAFLNAAPTLGVLSNTANLITVVNEITVGATANNTLALVTTLVRAAIDTAVQTAATKQVFIVVNAQNVGTVYSVANGVAINDTVVVREGSIDLADTLWNTLTAASLTTVGAQAEGASSAAIAAALTALVNNQVLVGTAGIDTLNNGGFTGVTMTGGAGADTFSVTGGTATITDLATGDNIVSTGGNTTAGATNALGVAAFTATSSTLSNGAGTVVINGLNAGSAINMALATGPNGYTINGGTGNDVLTGSANGDTITTGATGTDVVNGGAGNDTITAGGGTTTIDGGLGNDTINGGAGADTINVTSGNDTVTAFGTGADVITVSAGAIANVTTNAVFTATAASTNAGVLLSITAGVGGVLNLAAMTGTVGVTVIGNAAANTITGTALADTITGGAAADTITGGLGADTMTGAGAVDTFAFGTNGSIAGTSLDVITDFNTGGSDILTFGANTVLLGADATALVAGSGVGANVQTSAGGVVTFAAADNTLALKVAAVQADVQLDAINSVAMFVDSGNMYVYYAGAAIGNADDMIIQLTGQAALVTITAGATTTIA